MIEIKESDLAIIQWPPQCSICNSRAAEQMRKATGDAALATTLGLTVLKVYSIDVPCCGRCLKAGRSLIYFTFAIMIGPWVALTILSLLPTYMAVLDSILKPLMIASCASTGLGILTFWYYKFRSRTVRVYADTSGLRGLVFRHRSYAQEVASLNGFKLQKVNFLKGW